jgi:hypothetical protein
MNPDARRGQPALTQSSRAGEHARLTPDAAFHVHYGKPFRHFSLQIS